MIKTTLAVALLLGYSSALLSRARVEFLPTDENTTWVNGTYHIGKPRTTILDLDMYTIIKPDVEDLASMQVFWNNRTEGNHCISLFEKYLTVTKEIDILTEEARKIVT
jgi:hypothetical protein